jgi:4-hydroxy-tetrahydrodipicolinate synthase
MTPELTAELAKHPNIAGIKDGNKQIDHLAKVLYLTKDEDFEVFTGKDTTAFPFVAAGGNGTFTVAGNVIPWIMREMIELALHEENEKARKIHLRNYRLFEALRFESNPMAAKKALELMGLIDGTLRLPLTPLSEGKTKILSEILKERNLL